MKKYLLLIAIFLCYAPHAFAAFSYSKSITINAAQVPSTQSNFPVDVDVTQGSLATVANGGRVQNANGYDIYFYSTADCTTTRLPAERELYTAATGRYTGWVNVTSISNGTVIYMCYGDSSISTDPNLNGTFGATSVWDTNYKAVWHLKDGTTLDLTDSTGNVAAGTNNNAVTAVTGKIDGGANFVTASSQSLSFGSPAAVQITNNITLEAWFQGSVATEKDILVNQYRAGTNKGTALFTLAGTGAQFIFGDGTTRDSVSVATTYADGAWHQFVGTFASGSAILYVDGASVASKSSGVTSISYAGTDTLFIGRNQAGSSFSTQVSDETRISNTVRTANWITTEYNNQNATSTFYTIGAETALASPLGRFFLWTQTFFNHQIFIF